MSNYQRGAKLERDVVHIAKKKGYWAQRTAGSHSPVDVIVWNDKEIYFVQCKRIKHPRKNKLLPASVLNEMDKFKKMGFPEEVIKVFIVWIDRDGMFIKYSTKPVLWI